MTVTQGVVAAASPEFYIQTVIGAPSVVCQRCVYVPPRNFHKCAFTRDSRSVVRICMYTSDGRGVRVD